MSTNVVSDVFTQDSGIQGASSAPPSTHFDEDDEVVPVPSIQSVDYFALDKFTKNEITNELYNRGIEYANSYKKNKLIKTLQRDNIKLAELAHAAQQLNNSLIDTSNHPSPMFSIAGSPPPGIVVQQPAAV